MRDLNIDRIFYNGTGSNLSIGDIYISSKVIYRKYISETAVNKKIFMAREVLMDDEVIGPSCDVYSLGLIAYELLNKSSFSDKIFNDELDIVVVR